MDNIAVVISSKGWIEAAWRRVKTSNYSLFIGKKIPKIEEFLFCSFKRTKVTKIASVTQVSIKCVRTLSSNALCSCFTSSMCSSSSFLVISAVCRASSASNLASRAACSCSCFFINSAVSKPCAIACSRSNNVRGSQIVKD